jgi:hypothetical protein
MGLKSPLLPVPLLVALISHPKCRARPRFIRFSESAMSLSDSASVTLSGLSEPYPRTESMPGLPGSCHSASQPTNPQPAMYHSRGKCIACPETVNDLCRWRWLTLPILPIPEQRALCNGRMDSELMGVLEPPPDGTLNRSSISPRVVTSKRGSGIIGPFRGPPPARSLLPDWLACQ